VRLRAQRRIAHEPRQREGDEGDAGRGKEDWMERESVRVDDGVVDSRRELLRRLTEELRAGRP
jgi:hypothetical protein